MGLQQFANSLQQIVRNPHVPTTRGVLRHLGWQVRKTLNLFPFEQRLSTSRIVAAHRACSVSSLIHNQGFYDYNNMHLIRWLLQDGGVFFDIGANIGSYALIASEQAKAQVFAFEPHPETFRLLTSNVSLNRRENVCAVNIALGQSEETMSFSDHPGSSTNHLLDGQDSKSIPVLCRRADRYCRESGVTPQFVKLDVEGHEYEVLRGFGSSLECIQVLLIEMNGLSDQRGIAGHEIHSLLACAGLQGPWQCDFDRRLFHRRVGWGREDSLYLSSSYGRLMLAAGWRIEGRG